MKATRARSRDEETIMISKTFRITGMIILASLALSSAARAATCTNDSLRGTYGFSHGGTDSNGTPLSAAVSQLTFDSSTGTFTGETTSSRDGVLTTFSFTGTYAIASNCTGTGTPTGGNTFNFVVTPPGFLVAEPFNETTGVTAEGFAVKQDSSSCTNARVEGSFGLQTTGVFLEGASTTGAVALVGELKLMANSSEEGVIRGHLGGSEGGTILTFADEPVTGSYKVDADCRGTATIKPKGQAEMHFSIVVVDCGRELLVLETDDNTIVSGTLTAASPRREPVE
jgi:hypothetical protein